jgi:hypothetical protein
MTLGNMRERIYFISLVQAGADGTITEIGDLPSQRVAAISHLAFGTGRRECPGFC